MIESISGKLIDVRENRVLIEQEGIVFSLAAPRTDGWITGETGRVYTYLHWNADKGPTLYGFTNISERQAFLLLLDCPKIGPQIAITVLSQLTPDQFFNYITSQNESGLSSIKGVDAKKAEQIIYTLKNKVGKLISEGSLLSDTGSGESALAVHWQHLQDALTSLNYSKQEISDALKYLSEKHAGESPEINTLLRSALGFLSQGK